MRAWLLTAPWWALALVHGTFFGTVMGLWTRLGQGAPWGVAIPAGLLGGIFFGVFMGVFTARQNRRVREAAGGDGLEALSRLPVFGRKKALAERPELREASRQVVLHQRDTILRQRRWAVPLFGLLLALEVWLALTGSAWFWLAVALVGTLLVGHLVMPRRLERRAEELRGP